MDFGAEEIEFYTLNYPKTIGQEWEIENALHEELKQVRKCMPTRILFLDASNEVLLRHKENVDVLNVDNLNLAETKVDSKIPTYDCGCYIKR